MGKATTDAILLVAAIVGIISGLAVILDIAFNRWKYLKAFGAWLRNLVAIDSESVVLNIPPGPPPPRAASKVAAIPPPAQEQLQPIAFKTGYDYMTSDGVKATNVRYVHSGHDMLDAYTATRFGTSGTLYVVIRDRPGQKPMGIETSNRDGANLQWYAWWKEWREGPHGFGGASGNGIQEGLPF